MTLAVAAAAVLVVGLLAGCAATPAATGAVATATEGVTHAQNDRVPEGAVWTQHYFPSADGVELHADVLLPEGLAEGQKVPAILSAGAYFGHSGEMTVEGFAHTGPSGRFTDLVTEGGLLDRGYALVLVDTRGYGGSAGCAELLAGPGERADVSAAIGWAAAQPWSTGSVGMYGKSQDAVTALVGSTLDHPALKGVIAMEPIWDIYRNMRSGGVPRTTISSVSEVYNTIATLPQMPDDDPRYLANAGYDGPTGPHPECTVVNTATYMDPNEDSETWRVRDLPERAKGTSTPLFVTQGFLEWNTEAEGIEEFLAGHEGPQRAWLGQWDHKRGNDRTPDGRLETGREGWFDEALSFYDEHLKGIAPPVAYPPVAIQDSTGAWRAQDTWPVSDRTATVGLGGGSYVDDGLPAGPRNAFVARSEPVPAATRITGTPRVALDAHGHGNVFVRLHDVAPDGTAVVFDEQVSALRPGATAVELRSTDWTLPAGHVLAVQIGTVEPGVPYANDWLVTPSRETVTVRDARLTLALDDPSDDAGLPGAPAPWLQTYRQTNASKPAAAAPSFTLPGRTG
ncbi:CocE/NonD family hydrolase [Pseudonocardia sp. HH130630-07]|uniref:CocE/NonD family hydrolase n=1 Tax=Pseudonocardia sp. HH130630-07 TaxID=1690815 RepID=UPI001E5F4B61|nr:CocE/NonD family hydrolase [Pseudonocardia sp. HH130630-07]